VNEKENPQRNREVAVELDETDKSERARARREEEAAEELAADE
jgi:hypothetical protein